ncbi:hypothetical protein [Stutzerimonas zhaodongensis]|uniref:hypothetical protein n=1 Tax=Stutzerimonas zhaodongensis TaxID=1176257 RepID=UPI0011C455AB|nr:hypothetical protein [Stutzerimonas zhaodongensis]MCQ4317174.1 hypothetical protein [Stutzerimonas zhaodongensis]
MKPLNITLKISIFLLWLAAGIFVIGGTIAVILFPKFFNALFISSIATAALSVPFTIASLALAYKERIITRGYVLFSIVFSCFVAGLGWFVIPFLLKKDIESLEPQAEGAAL